MFEDEPGGSADSSGGRGRRTLLRGVGGTVTAAGLAGCLGLLPDSGGGGGGGGGGTDCAPLGEASLVPAEPEDDGFYFEVSVPEPFELVDERPPSAIVFVGSFEDSGGEEHSAFLQVDQNFASITPAALDSQVKPDADDQTTVDGETVPIVVGSSKGGRQVLTNVYLPFDIDGEREYWEVEILLNAFRDREPLDDEDDEDVEASSSCKEVVRSVGLEITKAVEKNEDTSFFDE